MTGPALASTTRTSGPRARDAQCYASAWGGRALWLEPAEVLGRRSLSCGPFLSGDQTYSRYVREEVAVQRWPEHLPRQRDRCSSR